MAESARRSQELLAETWGLGRDLPADLTSRLLLLPQASRSDPTAPWQPQSESANRRAHGSGRSEQRAAAPGPWAHLCDIAAQTRTPNAAGADAPAARATRTASARPGMARRGGRVSTAATFCQPSVCATSPLGSGYPLTISRGGPGRPPGE